MPKKGQIWPLQLVCLVLDPIAAKVPQAPGGKEQ
jgi:hypothetical protein